MEASASSYSFQTMYQGFGFGGYIGQKHDVIGGVRERTLNKNSDEILKQ